MLPAFIVRVDQAGRLSAPHLLCEEFIYADLAKNFADEGRLLFRGEPLRLSLLYRVLLAPAWLAERNAQGRAAAGQAPVGTPSCERKTFAIPARRFPFRVTVHIEPTFSAAGFGTGDDRELGALVDFGFRPTSQTD